MLLPTMLQGGWPLACAIRYSGTKGIGNIVSPWIRPGSSLSALDSFSPRTHCKVKIGRDIATFNSGETFPQSPRSLMLQCRKPERSMCARP